MELSEKVYKKNYRETRLSIIYNILNEFWFFFYSF